MSKQFSYKGRQKDNEAKELIKRRENARREIERKREMKELDDWLGGINGMVKL